MSIEQTFTNTSVHKVKGKLHVTVDKSGEVSFVFRACNHHLFKDAFCAVQVEVVTKDGESVYHHHVPMRKLKGKLSSWMTCNRSAWKYKFTHKDTLPMPSINYDTNFDDDPLLVQVTNDITEKGKQVRELKVLSGTSSQEYLTAVSELEALKQKYQDVYQSLENEARLSYLDIVGTIDIQS